MKFTHIQHFIIFSPATYSPLNFTKLVYEGINYGKLSRKLKLSINILVMAAYMLPTPQGK